jgi:hypothetical protein
MNGLHRRSPWAVLAVLLVSTPAAPESESTPTVLVYEASMDDEVVGWARAVHRNEAGGTSVRVTSSVKTSVLGIPVEIGTDSRVEYDGEHRAGWFDIEHEKPTGDIHVTGERTAEGFVMTRVRGGDADEVFVSHEEYDHVSVEPTLWQGEVGSKEKARVLFAGKGEVGKATIRILDRQERTVLGREQTVTHVRISSSAGRVDEWRLDGGIMVRSVLKTPIGRIFIELAKIGK